MCALLCSLLAGDDFRYDSQQGKAGNESETTPYLGANPSSAKRFVRSVCPAPEDAHAACLLGVSRPSPQRWAEGYGCPFDWSAISHPRPVKGNDDATQLRQRASGSSPGAASSIRELKRQPAYSVQDGDVRCGSIGLNPLRQSTDHQLSLSTASLRRVSKLPYGPMRMYNAT
ncbi:hypothetical protein MGYG_00111 [Nannizzia gypsea CBS 118893]|uniref:Uncharacterized protein n=1 Tax=Arthroderma gypseum (strain ATCC MYA-4604 / CBS 118893) TaxID=535722 RepID=E5R2T4_ARTGP|nr:hypothetical protein MGYG_00111 [Nannizzia gypsea CBS 118893]EFQ97068.1 hypothetical protein MGYG_00111 [Nannizzia gypsea CBS 118893]